MPTVRHPFLLLLFSCCLVLSLHQPDAWGAERKIRILASTFPVYQLVRNISQGDTGVELDLMIPSQMGCPHDYALTPQDMLKLAHADVFIVNGLGMEEFLGAPIQKANARLKIIDSSQGIEQILVCTGKENAAGNRGATLHEDGHGPNPHLFASPRMAALLVANIARGFAGIYPAGADRFAANAKNYEQRLNRLADDMAALCRRLPNKRIVTQHEVFDYLARDIGLEVVGVVQAHPGQNPSAAEILALVKTIKTKKAGALFTEPQYPEAVGATLAKEAGIVAARLDPAASGPDRAPLEYYEQVMRHNMTVLEQTLGRY